MVAAAGISAAGSLLGGLFGSNSAAKAAKYQLKATREQIAATERNRDYQYDLNAPVIGAGDRAGDLYSGFLGAGATDWGAYADANPDIGADYRESIASGEQLGSLDEFAKNHYENFGRQEGRVLPGGDGGASKALDTFRNSTGYQDLLQTGLSAVNSNAYARGIGDSGSTLKALQRKGTAIADQSAQGWLGNLGTLMNLGGQARGLVAGVGTNSVNAINQATQNGADAQSNAALVSGQNWSNVLQNIGNSAAYAYGSSYGAPASGAQGAAPYALPPYAGLRG